MSSPPLTGMQLAGAPPNGARPGGPPRGWRRYLFPGVWLAYLMQVVGSVHDYSHGGWGVVGYTVLVLFAAAYLCALATMWSGRRTWFWVTYAGMLAAYAVEAPLARQSSSVLLIFLTVLTIGAVRRYAVPVVAGYVAVAVFLPPLVPGWHSGVDAEWAITIPLVAMAMFGFFEIIKANQALAAARAEVARLAAENERTRIARDLHDLLGQSLTTITVKAGLARRLAQLGEVDRAGTEIADVERLSRRSLSDVRAAVAGHRDLTLAGELATAREVLRASGIVAHLPGSVDLVDPTLSELFGWVVREGVTNAVRHSRATHCTITLGPNWIEIADDGRGSPGRADRPLVPSDGNGLTGLRERVEAAGGNVRIDPRAPGWRLRVEA
ncbi:MAG: sensor histidine kinase, partial [Micromonosporaceae bacterium]|nr:sensor histidine kinase [Micromonosporaceae bacterium]